MKNINKWDSLSIKDKADLMKLYIKNGINNLEEIRSHYNKFQDGGERNIINPRHAKLLARRGMPGDAEALRAAGYDKYGNPIVIFEGGSFSGGGAGTEFSSDNIKSKDYDYIRNTPLLHSFSDAFNNARKAGKNTFVFNGKEYTTEISDNPNYVGKQYEPLLNIREILDKNMKVIPDSTKIEPYLGQIPGTSKREYNNGGKLGVPYKSLNDSNYDYYNASTDNIPTKKGEHWTSRNPNTGRILKGANHPTIDVALNMEGVLGNKIYKNIDGTYSSYEENQFPTSWGVQINNYEYDVSPLDSNKRFKDIKTTKGRKYNEANITYISDKLNNTLLSDAQKNAILGSIIEESGGNPFAVDETGKFKGLLQWEDSRYSPDNSLSEREEIDKQLQYLIETLYNTDDKKSWTHGGKGSGYKSAKHARDSFLKAEDLYEAVHALNRGYIRPTGGDYSVKNRYKVAKQIK